ncbi:4'-phosphopantetheinyl transferase [Piedraia hortae CBS 480.64]|uniref:4'-phosphopantetheinyl transferase n=1 Tax=Piedraia hortae CBS 480.64 TaxID=1314780 RepID=A0A6A7CAA0_9PEZI|nr:4'-phosphopantetheinyl transferase [Piedraia hortae CBS 480.64]
MPPRPFPLQLGIGTDIAQISRIRQLIDSSSEEHGVRLTRFMTRFLTWREQEQFWKRFQDASGPQKEQSMQYLAGRWAAKEAAIKAVGRKDVTPFRVQILSRTGNGSVYGVVLDKCASAFRDPKDDSVTPGHLQNDDLPGQVLKISISHDGDYATAVCLAPLDPLPGDVGGEAEARGYAP